MNEIGKLLVIVGALLVVAGLLLWKTNLLSWLGRLPGDIHITGKAGSFYFPIVTCLIVSALLTLVMWLFRK